MGTNGITAERQATDLIRDALNKGLDRMAEGDTLVIIDDEESLASIYKEEFDEGPGSGMELSVHYRRVDQMSLDLFS